MWCSRCQQEVPAVAQPGAPAGACPRCQYQPNQPQPAHTKGISDQGLALDEPACIGPQDPVEQLRDWRVEQRFRNLARTLRGSPTLSSSGSGESASLAGRIDPPQDLFHEVPRLSDHPTVAASRPSVHPTRKANRRATGEQVTSWLIVLFGVLTFGGGVGLGSWSLTTKAPQFWNGALALTLVGQGLLILGLVLVLLRLWRNSRYTTGKLLEVHWQIGQLQRTAETIAGLRQGNAPAFYAELVRGASPQMLLANLKGQLDQLAVRVHSERL